MSADKKDRKLKVKFSGRFRDNLQCRKTKVRITMPPEAIEDRIKYYSDTVRDLENILEVMQEVNLEDKRPSIGELLHKSNPHPANDWEDLADGSKQEWQEWGNRFISNLQNELYLTESLQRGEADDHIDRKRATVKAIQKILDRR